MSLTHVSQHRFKASPATCTIRALFDHPTLRDFCAHIALSDIAVSTLFLFSPSHTRFSYLHFVTSLLVLSHYACNKSMAEPHPFSEYLDTGSRDSDDGCGCCGDHDHGSRQEASERRSRCDGSWAIGESFKVSFVAGGREPTTPHRAVSHSEPDADADSVHAGTDELGVSRALGEATARWVKSIIITTRAYWRSR